MVDKKYNYRFNISVVRSSKKGVVAQIEGISSRTELEKFYGLDLYVDRSVLPELKDEEFYYSDLVGLLVNDIDGNFIGKVKSMENFGAGCRSEKYNGRHPVHSAGASRSEPRA